MTASCARGAALCFVWVGGAGFDVVPARPAAVAAAGVSEAARGLLVGPRSVHVLEGVAV
ncbi:hypothetical protein [Streptomyces sp. AS02]|uniref:hypothetical protein n=1 Tax=Streptomyces sp. AS02 TaxID=2938946 RepID=UPI002020125B|nr:hypothetical protein [Streptomyces sp. AS02]MCL8015256.1 hypothetical protein [Streptomyces sp. AS02]